MSEQQVKKEIKNILKQFAAVFDRHGGGAELVAIEPDTLVFKLIGHCNGCAMAPITFGLMLEQMIKEKLPHIKTIRYTE